MVGEYMYTSYDMRELKTSFSHGSPLTRPKDTAYTVLHFNHNILFIHRKFTSIKLKVNSIALYKIWTLRGQLAAMKSRKRKLYAHN